MLVNPTGRDALRAQRRETFFSDVVDPMVAEARAVGIPLDEVVARIRRLASTQDGKEDRCWSTGSRCSRTPAAPAGVFLIRETGDKDEKVSEAPYTASRLRVGWDGDCADALVERFQIPRAMKLGQLSRGQRSALDMIFGLAARAPVTLLDERHLGMDAPSRAAFSDEPLTDFMAHPRTIVISTHLIDELSPLFEEVLGLALEGVTWALVRDIPIRSRVT